MTKAFVCAFLAALLATPVWAEDKEPVKTTDGVIVSGEFETIFMDKKSPEEKTLEPKEPEKVVVSGEIEHI